MKNCLRIIGDVHGMYDPYIEIAQQAEYTLQLGDLGFNYDCLRKLDPEKHKVLAGNHDNYSKWGTNKFILMGTGHWLGDYGVHEVPGFGKIFFVRGGYSIDYRYRKEGETWFREEEMSYKEMQDALTMYMDVKPDFVVSHECPADVAQAAWGVFHWDGELIKPSSTSKLLQAMWSNHSPKFWLFGHHHKVLNLDISGTNFHCVPELGYIDFDRETKEIIDMDAGCRE